MKEPSRIEFQLLVLLDSRPERLSGREIASAYRSATGNVIPKGTLYTTLARLLSSGLLVTREDQKDKRISRFTLTADGRVAVFRARRDYAALAAFGPSKKRSNWKRDIPGGVSESYFPKATF